MVAQPEAIDIALENLKNNNQFQKKNIMMMVKGKRTKRSRPLSPLLALTMSSASASATATSLAVEEGGANSATSAAAEFDSSTVEEQDMAHCLILLAQGNSNSCSNNKSNNKVVNNGGITSYDCKTCNRSFPSFQALGGHRASHKKPKLNNNNNLASSSISISPIFSIVSEQNLHQFDQFKEEDIALSLQIANNGTSPTINSSSSFSNSVINKANKVHECSICGAEFSSGQALGGHMRRHRPIGSPLQSVPPVASTGGSNDAGRGEKTKSLLSLDLNLPAPEDDHHHRDSSKFVFASNEKTLVFSASSLVDCHY